MWTKAAAMADAQTLIATWRLAGQRGRRSCARPRRTARPRLGNRRTRLQVHLRLAAREAWKLERLAEADLRSVDNYLSKLVVEDLKRGRARPSGAEADLPRRSVYPVRLWLTAKERKALSQGAEHLEIRMGACVRTLVAEVLG